MKNTIEAAYHDEFVQVLDRLGLWDALESGKLMCGFCDAVVDLNSAFGVYSEAGKIRIACTRPECAGRLVEKSLRDG